LGAGSICGRVKVSAIKRESLQILDFQMFAPLSHPQGPHSMAKFLLAFPAFFLDFTQQQNCLKNQEFYPRIGLLYAKAGG